MSRYRSKYGDKVNRKERKRGRKMARYMNEEEGEVTRQKKIDEGGPSG